MNLANKLTVTRICLVPLFILFLELQTFWSIIFASIVFVVASITDFLDGYIARRRNMITSLGTFLDPLADKLLISAALICFVDIPILRIPAWMVIAIISREFLITGLRTMAAKKNVIIPADNAGKFKTISQIVVILIVLLVLLIEAFFLEFYGVTVHQIATFKSGYFSVLALILHKTPFWVALITTILTIYSGGNYIWKHRDLLKEDA